MKGDVMNENDPSHFSQIITWLWVVGLSSLGGMVSYFNSINKKKVTFSLFRLITEVVTSAFVGIVTFMLCDLAKFDWQLTASMVAVSGHMGTRALFKLEVIFNVLKKVI